MTSAEIVVAVHRLDRPIARAVGSILDQGPDVGAILVGHGLGVAALEGVLDGGGLGEWRERVRVIRHDDGIPSPAGPFNAGLDAAEADFVGVMGSDDTLAPGAVAAWLGLVEQDGLDVVLARVEYADGGLMRTPPTRGGRRTAGLAFAADRLAYRTAPLGVMRRSLLDELGLRFTEGLASGEDLAFTLALVLSGAQVGYAAGAPAYLVGSDAVDRVTHVDRAVREEFSAIRDLMDRRWFRALGERDRLAIVVKLLRIHVFGLLARRTATAWSEAERTDLARQLQAILGAAPEVTRVLSRAEANLLDAALDPSTSPERLVALGRRRTRHGRPGTILTRDPRALLDPQAPLRLMIASARMR